MGPQLGKTFLYNLILEKMFSKTRLSRPISIKLVQIILAQGQILIKGEIITN
jgi:hypothetical protein